MRILLTESASLTSRETLTVLGRNGIRADVASSGALTVSRFSRWRGGMVRLPALAGDPVAYVRALGEIGATCDAVVPTHEQAWLLAAGRHLLPRGFRVALASIEAFEQVQSKVALARTLDRLGLPQPRWWLAGERPAGAPTTWWVKAAYSTAGRGVRRAGTPEEGERFAREVGAGRFEVMCQASAPGRYGQVQAVFDHGRMVAAHTSVAEEVGMGGSAAARRSVDHPEAREVAATLGREIGWHGGLTLDYHHTDGHPQVIECNPRMVEPGNAFAAGINLPLLLVDLARGEPMPARCLVGRAGVRTHGTLALVMGAASRASRREAVRALVRGGGPLSAAEVQTPAREDPVSGLPLAFVVAQVLAWPGLGDRVASGAVGAYAVTPEVVSRVRNAVR